MIIFSLGLALPWPLLLQWLTKNYKKAHPNQNYEDGETGSKPEFESSDEKGEKRRAESFPILTYIIAPSPHHGLVTPDPPNMLWLEEAPFGHRCGSRCHLW